MQPKVENYIHVYPSGLPYNSYRSHNRIMHPQAIVSVRLFNAHRAAATDLPANTLPRIRQLCLCWVSQEEAELSSHIMWPWLFSKIGLNSAWTLCIDTVILWPWVQLIYLSAYSLCSESFPSPPPPLSIVAAVAGTVFTFNPLWI